MFGTKICLLHKMTLFYLAFMIDNCTLSASEKSGQRYVYYGYRFITQNDTCLTLQSGEIFTLLSTLFVKKNVFKDHCTVHQSESSICSDLKFSLILDPWTAIWFNSSSQVKNVLRPPIFELNGFPRSQIKVNLRPDQLAGSD